MNASLSDFYAAMKQAVMFSPQYVVPDSGNGKAWKCRQLHTFRVMQKERGSELASPNLGATICDKGKPFFWSRKWHQDKYNPNNITFEYPALLLTELSINSENSFSQSSKRCYSFQVAVVDQQTDDCTTCACESCEKRTVNEIFSDTENLLFSCLHYVSKIRQATLQPSGEEGFWNTDYLAALKEAGTINGYNPGADWGGLLNKQQVSGYRIAIDAQKIYGTAVNISVCFHNCEATQYNFNLPDFGVLSAESGCRTCG